MITVTSRRQFTFYHQVSKIPGTHFIDFGKMKGSTLEPPGGFEHGTPGLRIQRLSQ